MRDDDGHLYLPPCPGPCGRAADECECDELMCACCGEDAADCDCPDEWELGCDGIPL